MCSPPPPPREAANGREFIASRRADHGRAGIASCPAREEARLSALGVISGIHEPDGIAGDLGGGSLELIDIRKAQIGDRRDVSARRPAAARKASEKQLKKAEKSLPITAPARRRSCCNAGEKRRLLRDRRHLAVAGPAAHAPEGLSAPRHASVRSSGGTGGATSAAWSPAARSNRSSGDRGRVAGTAGRCCPTAPRPRAGRSRSMRPSEIVMSALGVREGFLYDLLRAEREGAIR